MRNPMKLEQDDDGRVAGDGDGQSPAVATLIPPAPAATHVPTATAMGTSVLTLRVRLARMHYVSDIRCSFIACMF